MQNTELAYSIPSYQEIPTFILLLFCGYVIEWYLQVGDRITGLGAIRFEFIYAACLSVLALYYTSPSSFECPLIKYFILYFVVIAIQVPLSYNIASSWQIFIDRIVKFAFMAWFIITFVKSPRGLIFFFTAFMLACMKMGQEGLIGRIRGGLIWENQGILRLHGVTSLYIHPNSFSGMAVGTLPFIIVFFPIVNKYLKVLLVVQAIFAFNIIIYTGSRTGYVATLLFALYLLYKSKINKFKLLIALPLLALIFIQFIPESYINRFESIYTLSGEGRSSEESRIQIIEDAWAIFLDHPFGVGVGAFPFIRQDLFGRSQDTHNLYLQIATNLGIQGLIIFGLLIYKMLSILNRCRQGFSAQIVLLLSRNISDQEATWHLKTLKILEASALGVYLFVLVRLALGLFGMDLYEIYWWFAGGLTIAIYNLNEVATQQTELFLIDSQFTDQDIGHLNPAFGYAKKML